MCFNRTNGDSKHNILNQLNLSVPAAQHLALLGDSGSGKTTF
ncbi:ATP-binding cassette domain-containing protein [Litorilituus sediminis]